MAALLSCGVTPLFAQPRILLADPQRLHGSYFSETVVLAVDHGERGSVGVILNRPSIRGLDDMVPEGSPLRGLNMPIFEGGPVSRGLVVFLFRSVTAPEGSDTLPVAEDIYLSFSATRLTALLADPAQRGSVRMFHGYTGWAVGQLDDEIRRRSWVVLPDKPGQVAALVYGTESGHGMWDRLIAPFRGIWVKGLEILAAR